MDLKFKRNRAVHVNAEIEMINSHKTWVCGERHLHVRVTQQGTKVAPMGKKHGNEWIPANIDTILTEHMVNEKLHWNHKREGQVFTGDRKKGKIEE